MSSSKLTILGFYEYLRMNDDDLFVNLHLPDGIDKQTVIDTIIMRAADFEVLYANPDYMKNAIGTWSNKWNRTFTKWIEALSIEYAPLENYDRMEDWTTTDDGSVSSRLNSRDSNTVENKVSAYNSNSYEPNGFTESNGQSGQEGSGTNKNTNVRTGRAHGNIGVTTSQQMLLSELEEAAIWSLYDRITDLFLAEFVIPIY